MQTRDLSKTLKFVDQDWVMDYCKEFDYIKSIIEYLDNHVQPIKSLHFRSGNEQFIVQLSTRFRYMFSGLDLSDPVKLTRKILVFLLLHTDITFKYDLKEMPQLAHVINILPTIPKFLYIAIIWEMKMDIEFYELLSYSPCWLSFQLFNAAIESLKYINDPFEELVKTEHLLSCIIQSMTLSKNIHLDKVDQKCIFNRLYDYTMNTLRQFHTPDLVKFTNLKKMKKCQYNGLAINSLLNLVNITMSFYENPNFAERKDYIDYLYDIFYFYTPKVNNVKCPNETLEYLKEYQLKILHALLNSLQYQIMLVNVDTFMIWVEVKMGGNENLQSMVGTSAYQVINRINSNKDFQHDIVSQLQILAIKPKSLTEKVKESTIGEILTNIDSVVDDKERMVWYSELFERKMTFGNDECLNTMKKHIKFMSGKSTIAILNFIRLEIIRNHIENLVEEENSDQESQHEECLDYENFNIESIPIDTQDYKELIEIVHLSLSNLNNKDLINVFCHQKKLFSEKAILFSLSDREFKKRFNLFLNSFVQKYEMRSFLELCFMNPLKMWFAFIESSCQSEGLLENFCKIVEETKKYCSSYLHMILPSTMLDSNMMLKKNFPNLISRIYFLLYYPDNVQEFLKNIFNKSVTVFLDTNSFNNLLVLIKILICIDTHGETNKVKPLNFGNMTAPVLLLAASIMDKCRWDLLNFTNVRDECVRECIQFTQKLSNKFLPLATELDRDWIAKAIKKSYRPLTQYYFQKYSLKPSETQLNFDSYLMKSNITEKAEIEKFLVTNFVRCTMKETEWLARSEILLPHISDFIIILNTIVGEKNDCNTLNSYKNSINNYANIVAKFLIPQVGNEPHKIERLNLKLLKIIKSVPECLYDEIFLIFEKLMIELLKQPEGSLPDEIIRTIRKFVLNMKPCQGKTIFLDKFNCLFI